MLSLLSQYLRQCRCASLTDLALAVHASPLAVEAMLNKLIAKGLVQALPPGTPCPHAACCNCNPHDLQLYEWLGSVGNEHTFYLEPAEAV